MRADRLLQILLILQRSGKVTSRQLAERLEVSDRTIFRDMEALCAAGVPLLADRGSGGGWYLQEGYKTALSDLRKEDIQSLLLPQLWLLPTYGKAKDSFERASRKLLSSLPQGWRKEAEEVRRRIHVDGAGWHEGPGESGGTHSVLTVLQDAIWAGRRVGFEYSREDQEATRVISPFGLVIKGTVWYLVGYVHELRQKSEETGAQSCEGSGCPEPEAVRTYRVSRIAAARLLEEPSEALPDGFDLAAYWEASITRFKEQLPVYRAVLLTEPGTLPRLYATRYLRVESVQEQQKGPLRVHVRFDTLESAVSILLSFAGEVAAAEPPELRDAVRQAAERIAAAYSLPAL